jgi:hypothetical protein
LDWNEEHQVSEFVNQKVILIQASSWQQAVVGEWMNELVSEPNEKRPSQTQFCTEKVALKRQREQRKPSGTKRVRANQRRKKRESSVPCKSHLKK